MNKKNKTIIIVLLVVIIFSVFQLSFFAIEKNNSIIENVDSNLLVYDYADLLTDSEEEDLRTNAKELSDKGTYKVVILTIDSNSSTTSSYADDFFDYNNFGSNGILYIIDMYNREINVSTSGDCLNIYSKDELDYMTDSCYENVHNGDYYKSCESFLNIIECKIDTGNINTEQDNTYYIPNIIDLFIGIIIAVIVMMVILKERKTICPDKTAGKYMNEKSFNISDKKIQFTGSHTTTCRINTEKSSGHVSSSGATHQNSGRSF